MRTVRRFTDIYKWSQLWFRELTPACKLFFLYLVDECDAAGVWEIDLKMAEFKTGLPTEKVLKCIDILETTNRIQRIGTGDTLWLTKFIMFQYPKGLKEGYNPHKPIYDSILKNGLPLDKLYASEALINPQPTLHGMGMDTDKDLEKDVGEILDQAIGLWNREVSPKIVGKPQVKHNTKGRPKRLSRLRSRLKESRKDIPNIPKDADELYPFRYVCEKVKYSNFLTGNASDWKCTFDWVLNPTNWQKILDGNYDGQARIKEVDHGAGF